MAPIEVFNGASKGRGGQAPWPPTSSAYVRILGLF